MSTSNRSYHFWQRYVVPITVATLLLILFSEVIGYIFKHRILFETLRLWIPFVLVLGIVIHWIYRIPTVFWGILGKQLLPYHKVIQNVLNQKYPEQEIKIGKTFGFWKCSTEPSLVQRIQFYESLLFSLQNHIYDKSEKVRNALKTIKTENSEVHARLQTGLILIVIALSAYPILMLQLDLELGILLIVLVIPMVFLIIMGYLILCSGRSLDKITNMRNTNLVLEYRKDLEEMLEKYKSMPLQ